MTETKSKLPLLNKNIDVSAFVIGAMFLLTIATGFVNQIFLSLGILACCVALLVLDKLCLAFPFMLFYYTYYGLVLGVSVFRVYTLLLILGIVFKYADKYKLKNKYLPVLFVYAIYLVVVMMPQGISSAVFIFLDIICCFILVSELEDNETLTRDCFKIYTVLCFSSYLTGIVSENTIGGGYNYTRFNATFEDPNYMGFFFTIAVFSVITLKLFDKRVRYLIVLAIYAMMMASLSMTAIVVNILAWAFYCALTGKMKIKFIIIVVGVVALLISLYYYGLENPNTSVLGELSARIEEKLTSLNKGDIGAVTTGRSDLAMEHLKYYFNSSLTNIVFGGIPSNVRYIHPDLDMVAHNEYVDMLLNVGLVGAVIMFKYFCSNYIRYVKNYGKSKSQSALFLVMIKSIWMCYAMTLTMFLDFRFAIFFFI